MSNNYNIGDRVTIKDRDGMLEYYNSKWAVRTEEHKARLQEIMDKWAGVTCTIEKSLLGNCMRHPDGEWQEIIPELIAAHHPRIAVGQWWEDRSETRYINIVAINASYGNAIYFWSHRPDGVFPDYPGSCWDCISVESMHELIDDGFMRLLSSIPTQLAKEVWL
jgi:hypothetical protein